jgi:glutamate synthase domain-containing protein 2
MKNIIIKTAQDGPLVVKNLKELTEANGDAFPIEKKTIALCRCGHSKNKPFCDGTHGKINWKSRKEDDRQPRKTDDYEGEEIIIHDDRGICAHIGNCTGGLPEVFQMGKDPWIDPNGESAEKIIETIKKCPSGALSYTKDGEKHDKFSDEPEVKVTENGPYYIKGTIELEDDDEPESDEHYALCRCGESKNKPFCDGAHRSSDFADEGEAKEMPKIDDPEKAHIQKLAKTGKSENSAMGTLKDFPGFDTLTFKSAQLAKLPVNQDTPVNTKTIIGKTAKHPLEISMPFYVSHMSFGAVSKETKIALAKGASVLGTAECSGEGGFLPEEREAADKFIYEVSSASFTQDDDFIKQADAVEIKIGQAAKPGMGGHVPGDKVNEQIAKIRNIKKGEASVQPARFEDLNNEADLRKKVKHLREVSGGKPIGIKFSAGHIEKDIEFALKAQPDFITIDCRGGGTGSAPKFLKDNVGIPAVFAVHRARKYLDKAKSDVTLCVTGGFRSAADIAKAIALGADAVALATASLIAIGCIQARVCHTGTCPAGITTQNKQLREMVDYDEAVEGLVNYYTATNDELKVFARTNGVEDIHKLNISDLVTDNVTIAHFTDIEHV